MKRVSRKPGRQILAMLLIASLAGVPLVSEAKLGGSRPSSTSMTSSSSYASSSSRMGGGGSAGMTRPDVMAKARSAPAAPAGMNAGAVPPVAGAASAPAGAPQRSGPGWGTVAGAAAVGAAAGYMLGDHNSPQAPGMVQQGGVDNGQGGMVSHDMQRSATQAGAPMQQQSSGGFGFGSVLVLLLLTGAGFWAFRRYQASQANGGRGPVAGAFKQADTFGGGSAAPAASIADSRDAAVEQTALKSFNELQDANNRSDLAFLRTRLDDMLFQQIESDILARGGPGRTSVVTMRAQVVDVTDQGLRRLVSIRYTGSIVEGPDAAPESLDEVWHFVDENRGFWKLAGIEQV